MATKRLIGKDGAVGTFIKGEALKTGTLSNDENVFYVATKIATETSGLPTGLKTGYIFKGSEAMELAQGDEVIPLTFKKKCDIRSASIEFSKDEIDVTTLCDDTKKYRAGFSDAQGSLDGITTIGVSEDLIGKFIDVVKQGPQLTNIEIKELDGEPLYLNIEVNAKSTGKEAIAGYIAPVVLLSYNGSVELEGEQTFSSDFRITPDDNIKAAFYEITVA